MPQESFSLPAYAKINWFLEIAGKREDNYHEICTVFQTISLNDTLSFEASENLFLTCDEPSIPTDESNIIIRAALKLKEKFAVEKGAVIHLQKSIPSPGGLGGGSSDAAVAMLGLSKLWNLKIDTEELCEIGKSLGADVPFFFYGGTALGTGTGTMLTPISDIEEKFLLVVTPNVSVSTPAAYAQLNAPRLTNADSKSNLNICRNKAEKLDLRQSNLRNDFESVIFDLEPEIKRVKDTLLELGAVNALMSGSGASVFGIFDKEETRQTTIKAIQSKEIWRMFAVATISRENYRKALFI